MKSYSIRKQEENNYCLCSCLQAILKYHNILREQREIADKLSINEMNNGFMINDEKIKRFLNDLGFKYNWYYYNETPFNEHDYTLECMKEEHGIVGIQKHVYLLKNFKDSILTLINPENCSEFEKKLSVAIEYMKLDNSGGFGLIRKI